MCTVTFRPLVAMKFENCSFADDAMKDHLKFIAVRRHSRPTLDMLQAIAKLLGLISIVIPDSRHLESLLKKRDQRLIAFLFSGKHRLHLTFRNATSSGQKTQERFAQDLVQIAKVHWANLNDRRVILHRTVNLEDGVMHPIDSHSSESQSIQRRTLISVIWIRRMYHPLFSQYALRIWASIKRINIGFKMFGVHVRLTVQS